jgi:hypothetical protein
MLKWENTKLEKTHEFSKLIKFQNNEFKTKIHKNEIPETMHSFKLQHT